MNANLFASIAIAKPVSRSLARQVISTRVAVLPQTINMSNLDVDSANLTEN